MTPSICSQIALAVAVSCAVFPACADEPASPNRPDASATAKSVTVFPIVLNAGKPINGVPANMSKNMAELVGLFLERGGVKEIEIADTQFTPSEKDDLAKSAEAFGEFVRSRKLDTEYALYGQFLGTPGKGIDEIRLVVVDRQGKVVSVGAQGPATTCTARREEGRSHDRQLPTGLPAATALGTWPIRTGQTLPRAKWPDSGPKSRGFPHRASKKP